LSDVVVRPARPEDLDALVSALGQAEYFAHRLSRQPRLGVLLVATLDDGEVAGCAFLRLQPAEEWELRDRLRNIAVLTHVEVVKGQRRNGVGTRIVQAAEEQARRHGRRRIALGVKDDNPGARTLYEGLGFADWGRGSINALVETFEGDGHRKISTETCDILVKELTPVSRGTAGTPWSAAGERPGPAGRQPGHHRRRRGRPHRHR
jgi:GNAT superfamily N-acetyltransferase